MRFWPQRSQRNKRPRQQRSLRFESLEARMMLAANLLDSLDDLSDGAQEHDHGSGCCCGQCAGVSAESGNLFDGFLDSFGNRYFEESLFEVHQSAGEEGSAGAQSAPFPLSETFSLHSNPGANHTIFLDFDGHVTSGTYWNSSFNNGQDIVTPAYSIDGDRSTFSSSELERIQRVWRWVSEDFLPFEVDVTTEDPGVAALTKSSGSDTQWGVRIVIGPNTFYNSAGGVAYLNSFNWSTDTPAFVFNSSELGVAEAASHEAGHTLGLYHDGQSPGDGAYYYGHGSGTTGWAPIMGVGYYENLTQWSRGEYSNANNTEDDLFEITTYNGFGYRSDDHGNTNAAATVLVAGGGTISGEGIIERNTDYDVFSFTADGGQLDIDVDPFDFHPNLDLMAELYSSSGALIASSNPTGALNARISTTVTAGTYYLWISGVGEGDPLGTGYTDYGSLGYYSVSGTGAGAGAEEDTIAPGASLSISDITAPGESTHTFTVTFNDNVAVDVSQLDSSDLLVAGPIGFSAGATLVSVNDNSDGTPRIATYQIAAPGGVWDGADNGTYTINLQANEVSDTSGNFITAGSLGSFAVDLPVADRFEANDSFADATNLGNSDRTEASLNIHSSDDSDYFKWTAPDDGTLNIDVLFQHADGDVDVFVHGPDLAAMENSLSVTDNESLSISVTAGETYYVHVYGYDGATNPDYDLIIDGPESLANHFVVTSTGDGGDVNPGDGVAADASGNTTLRAAIEEANALANADANTPDLITFNIPGAGTHTIAPLSGLPGISEAVVIDGTTEPGFAETPLIELNGAQAGTDTNGLTITADGGGSTIRGLVVNQFSGHGVVLAQSEGNTVLGNFIGMDVTGALERGNGKTGVFLSNADGNLIGGPGSGDGNVISGNAEQGIRISGSSNNTVQGNLIGTVAAGTSVLGNLHGISLVNSSGNVIGGTSEAERNVVSGNQRFGVQMSGDASVSNRIEGNFIGTDITGSIRLGNHFQGVVIAAGASFNTIGGTSSGVGNVISGNNRNGVFIRGVANNLVQGNLIGTDASGNAALGNELSGVAISGDASYNTVGGTTVGSGNIISANGQHGVRLSGSSSSNLVQGNFIGTGEDGTTGLGNSLQGVAIINASSNQIGGTSTAARNVISDNHNGVRIYGVASIGNRLEGNIIGTDATGSGRLGNHGEGVEITEGAGFNTIGGTVDGAGNVIANNGASGVAVGGNGKGNTIQRNSIFANANLGIDLDNDGLTSNDAGDDDTGANHLQNFPLIQSAELNGNLTIDYLVDATTANSAYDLTVQFFLADADSQEGMTFLGEASYAASNAGAAATATLTPGAASVGNDIVATATDANGNTSEFSASFSITSASAPLLAFGGEATVATKSELLTSADLNPLLDAALAAWAAAGISDSQVARFEGLQVGIADFSGARLGEQIGNMITFDVNAAGYGGTTDGTRLDHAKSIFSAESDRKFPISDFRFPIWDEIETSLDDIDALFAELGQLEEESEG